MVRVLIVEDESIIAMDIEAILRSGGFEAAGIAATIERALEFVGESRFDCAILDANLGGKSAEPVARALASKRIPFVGVSGYARHQRPPAFLKAPFLTKPFSASDLLREVDAATRPKPSRAPDSLR